MVHVGIFGIYSGLQYTIHRLSEVTWFKPEPIKRPNACLLDYLITDPERRPFAIIDEGLAILRSTREQPKDSLPRISAEQALLLKD